MKGKYAILGMVLICCLVLLKSEPLALVAEETAPYVPAVTSQQEIESSPPAAQEEYLLNTNTKKFHRLDCVDIDKMKDSNKATASSREEAIAKGYSPCKHCNP